MRFMIDADEVLLDSIEANLILMNKKYGKNVKACDIKKWDFSDVFPSITSQEVEEYFNDPKFFENVKFKKGAELFLKKHGMATTIITKGGYENILQKQDYFQAHGYGYIDYIGLSLEESKGTVDMTGCIFVDDSEKNLIESNADVKILFENNRNAEWNKNWKGLRVRDFADLSFLLNYYIKH